MAETRSFWARFRTRIVNISAFVWKRLKAFLFYQVWCGYVFRILIWLDQGVNVVAGPVLNLALIIEAKIRGVDLFLISKFGFPDETLSSVFGKNKRLSCWCGWIAWGLDKIDRGHTDLALERDEGLRFHEQRDHSGVKHKAGAPDKETKTADKRAHFRGKSHAPGTHNPEAKSKVFRSKSVTGQATSAFDPEQQS
jgi:hypothetical protein